MKTILHLCADMGTDSKPYKKAGYNVICVGKDPGIESFKPPKNVYGIIANPPCTEFSMAKTTGSPRDMRKGLKLVKECLRIIWECQYNLASPYSKTTPLKFWMLENPKGLLQRFLGKPSYEYSPWEFGDMYKKRTQLWGYFNHPSKVFYDEEIPKRLVKFDRLKTREIHYKGNEHLTRQERRSISSPGFVRAFFEANK